MEYGREKKGKSQIRTTNHAEIQILMCLEDQGYTVIKKGWPDFIAIKGDEIRFIEVKPNKRYNLKIHQKYVADILAKYGIKVELKSPDVPL